MKKVAIVTVAVLALGLAACNKNNADNNAANETAVENTASTDVNAADGNDVTANADAALNAAGNAVENAGNVVDNAQNAGREQVSFRLRRIKEGPLLRGGPFFVFGQSVYLGPGEEADPLFVLLLGGCRDHRPPAPTAEQSAQLNEAEDMLNGMAPK